MSNNFHSALSRTIARDCDKWEVLCYTLHLVVEEVRLSGGKWLFSENLAIYEIMWKKYCTARWAADDDTIRRMHFAYWIIKVTDTNPENVIIAFPLQTWICESAMRLHYTCIAGLFHMFCSKFAFAYNKKRRASYSYFMGHGCLSTKLHGITSHWTPTPMRFCTVYWARCIQSVFSLTIPLGSIVIDSF
jgi:hypothetical protein